MCQELDRLRLHVDISTDLHACALQVIQWFLSMLYIYNV